MKIEIVLSVLKKYPVYIRETSPQKKGHACPFHIHDEVELLRVTEGSFLFKTSEKTYYLYPGDIVFVQSRTPHYTENLEENTDTQLISFPYEFFSGDTVPDTCQYLSRFLNAEKALSAVFVAGTPEANELSACFDAIIQEKLMQKPAYELYIKSGILAIIAFLSRNNIMPDVAALLNESDVNKIIPALDYIDSHYSSHIALKDISAVLNLNTSYFCRLFKKATGSSFIDYLNFVRICKTEQSLVNSQKGIAEIALDEGFSSTAYFNKVFKRYKGCTPTEYKKSKYHQEQPPL